MKKVNDAVSRTPEKETHRNVSFLLPVPPDRSGFVNQANLIEEIAKLGDVNLTIFTDTENPNKLGGNRIISIERGVRFPFDLLRKIRDEKIDLININYFYGLYGYGRYTNVNFASSAFNLLLCGILLRILGIKVVITMHSVVYDISKESALNEFRRAGYLNRIIRLFNGSLVRLANAVIVFSDFQKKALTSEDFSNRVHVIPYGFKKIEIKMIPHAKFTFLFFGFIRRNKGLLDLLGAFELISKRYSEIKLIVIGHADQSMHQSRDDYSTIAISRISKLKESLDITEFIGWADWDSILQSLAVSDVVVLPYTDSSNEISGVVADLSGAGIPLICSDTPRFRSMLRDESEALFFKPGNIVDLAAAMERMINEKELRDRLSRNLLSLANRLSWHNIGIMYDTLLNSLLSC